MDTVHTTITEPVRRLEVFTGTGRRRTWRDEDKARIVAEIATSGDSVCAVARRHGLSPQQLFGWRRRAKRANRIKLIYWDGTGLCPFAKRLGDGIFRWPKIEDGVMRFSAAQLSALLEGLDWRRVHETRETLAPTQPG
jgi:transposase